MAAQEPAKAASRSPSPTTASEEYSVRVTLVPRVFTSYESADGYLRRRASAVQHSDLSLKMERGDAHGGLFVYFCTHPSGCPAGARVVRTLGGAGEEPVLRIWEIGPHAPQCRAQQRHQAGQIPADTAARLQELFDEDSERKPADVIRLLEAEGLGWDHTKLRYKWQNSIKARNKKRGAPGREQSVSASSVAGLGALFEAAASSGEGSGSNGGANGNSGAAAQSGGSYSVMPNGTRRRLLGSGNDNGSSDSANAGRKRSSPRKAPH